MGKNVVEIEIPKEPNWETLEKKLNCENCQFTSCDYSKNYWSRRPSMVLECPKRAWPVNLLINWISVIPIFFLYRKVFSLTSGRFFLSISISLVILFFYDMFFILVEKLLISFFTFLEKNREKEYDKKMKEIKELREKKEEQEREKKEKERLYAQEVKNAQTIYRQFKKMEDLQTIQEKFYKPYSEMLNVLQELCEDLKSEHFEEPMVKELFSTYVPELLKTCENFILQYEKQVLSSREKVVFRRLLGAAKEKFIEVKQVMWKKETANLYVNMIELDQTLSTNPNKEDKE